MMRPFLLALALLCGLTGPAAAHKLKVFAAVEGDAVTGYAFFIGGGRARGTPWVAKDAAGAVIATGETDADGVYRFVPPQPVASGITITVDTREGHIASAFLAASRFGGAATVDPAAPAAQASVRDTGASATEAESATPPLADERIAALVEVAVQRQVEPLLERIEEMDSRLRFTDILSGLFLIAGLAGIGLWARGRR